MAIMTNRKRTRMILVVAIVIAAGIGAVMGARYAFWRTLGYTLGHALAASDSASACISQEIMAIPDLAGARVEVVYTNCDTLAKEEWVEVYLSRAAVKEGLSHRTLVLSYDPGGRSFANMPLPTITHPAPSTILISISGVSSVEYESRKWENMSIDYVIGKVQYPSKSK